MKKFSCDFETATWNPAETWVWAWASSEIGNADNVIIGNDIESFFDFVKNEKNPTCYFHNLKFDGEFILSYLLNNGYKYIENKKYAEDFTFTTLISDMGQFYSIEVYFEKKGKKVKKVTFIDSLKIIPFGVDKIAKSFKLPESKLKLDYNKPREKGHILTKEEKDYIRNDVVIVARALEQLFIEGLTKMTQASNALHDFKKFFSSSSFNHFFPQLDEILDTEIRKSYKGGFTYLNPVYKEKETGEGVVLDVNSLYPYVLYSKPLPFGEPIFFEGEYKEDKIYSLYVQMISANFKVKEGYIPTIQIKSKFGYKSMFKENEYLESSNGEYVTFVLTSVDLKLFLEHYEQVEPIVYHSGWKFKEITGLFSKYIDKWTERKIKAGKEGNGGQRQIAKLMLNALYGKFATSLKAQRKNSIFRRRRYCSL